jgi:hypothetical protein
MLFINSLLTLALGVLLASCGNNTTTPSLLQTSVEDPAVVSYSPTNEAVAITATLQVTFNEPMLSATFTPAHMLLTETISGKKIDYTFEFSNDAKILTVIPIELNPNTTYQLKLTGITDGINRALPDWTLDFETAASSETQLK